MRILFDSDEIDGCSNFFFFFKNNFLNRCRSTRIIGWLLQRIVESRSEKGYQPGVYMVPNKWIQVTVEETLVALIDEANYPPIEVEGIRRLVRVWRATEVDRTEKIAGLVVNKMHN